MKRRLLALRPLGLGDFLTAVPAFRALARAFPTHERILAAPVALHDLVALLGDTFGYAINAEPLEPLPTTLADIDIAVDLHGRGPASHRVLLELHPKRLVSFAHPAIEESGDGAAFDEDEHEVARWCRMLNHAAIPADPDDLTLVVPPELPHVTYATILHPGAASESRRWPVDRWVEIARHCEATGECVVVTGNRDERQRADAIVRGAGLESSRNVAGKTSLRQLAALVARARRVIAGDTGIAHLATAYRTPSILLFGPTTPSTWGPPADERHSVLWAGRRGNPHAAEIDPGLLAIPTNELIGQIERFRAAGR